MSMMRMSGFTMRNAAMTIGACAALAACAKKDAGTDSMAMGNSAAAMTTTASGGTMGDSASMAGGAMAGGAMAGGAMNAPKAMSDADIVAMVSAINQGEVDAGNMAKSKATNGDVKSFASDMVKHHTQMMNDGKSLATKASITPNMAAADSVTTANKAAGDKLASTAKGAAFDKAYIDAQVMGHQSALANVQAGAAAAQNADLKKMLTDAQPEIQKHLDKAKELQSKMGSAM
jgi:putative membrane protein